MLVIAPDNDAVIARMIRLPREGMRWRLEQWQLRERWIDLRYRARGGAWAIVRLVAREQPAPPPAYPSRVTESLRLVVLRSSPDAELPLLLDTLATQVQAHEADFRWTREQTPVPIESITIEPRDIEVEQLAFEAGIKPGARLRLERWEAPYTAWIWLRAGAAMTVLDMPEVSTHAWSYVMIGRTLAHAEALADAELRLCLRRADAMRDCGELLGYPRCCIEAFVESTVSRNETTPLDSQRSNFHRLDQAWVPAPHPYLNTLRWGERIGLISFDPCSLACPAALAVAEQIAAIVEAACPGYCESLRGVYAIDHDDSRVAVELDGDRRVLAARPIHEEAAGFAARIVGHHVDEQGRIPSLAEPCRVFEFH
jgi:hypothetical protein